MLQFVVFHLFAFVVSPLVGHFGWSIYGHLEWFVLPLLLPLSWVVNRYFTRPLGARIKNVISKLDSNDNQDN